ncbi:hypothetical protein FB451DRAFT_1416299 [Mycena latifolia]|nr:hypothetical protein FB451DRAFT_1416299 [Mycena latifolia]
MNVVRRIALSLFDRARRPASSLCTTMPLGDPLSAATVAHQRRIIPSVLGPPSRPPLPPLHRPLLRARLTRRRGRASRHRRPAGIVIATAPNDLISGRMAAEGAAGAIHAREARSGRAERHAADEQPVSVLGAFVLREPPNFALPAVASEREGSIGARRQRSGCSKSDSSPPGRRSIRLTGIGPEAAILCVEFIPSLEAVEIQTTERTTRFAWSPSADAHGFPSTISALPLAEMLAS